MEKQRWEESEKRRAEERRPEQRKSEKKEDAGAQKGSKVANRCVSPMICGSFGNRDVEKVHAVVARSTCRSQNVQNTPVSKHFWKLRCQKSARGCGAKHISKSKVLKTDGLGPLLDVQMSFGVAGARDCVHSQKWAKREGFCSSFNYNHHYTTLHYIYNYNYTTLHYTTLITLHYTTLRYITLRYTNYSFNYNYNHITLHYTTLTAKHYTKLHYTPLHDIPLHYTTLDYATLHYITLQLQLQLQLQLYFITLHSTTLIRCHYTTPHHTTLHYTTLTTTAATTTTTLLFTTLH